MAYPVVEIFGPTMQGEGALAGRMTHFVRFGGCDFACLWCDSAPAVLAEEVRKAPRLNDSDIIAALDQLSGSPAWVTLTGGNPLLHKLGDLTRRLRLSGFKVAVETQGTRFADWLYDVDLVTVSPKGPSAGNVTPLASVAEFVPLHRSRAGSLAFKVVIFNDDDYEYAAQVHAAHPRVPFYLSVGTYMGGLQGDYGSGVPLDDAASIVGRWRQLIERVAADRRFGDVAAFAQLHTLVWGHERGH